METLYEYFQRIGLLDYEATPSAIAEAKRQLGEYKVNRPGEQYWILEK